MGQVLVLVDDERDGTVRRSTGALLTIARRLGEPVAVCRAGRPTAQTIRVLRDYGAVRICTIEDALATADATTLPAARAEPFATGFASEAASPAQAVAEIAAQAAAQATARAAAEPSAHAAAEVAAQVSAASAAVPPAAATASRAFAATAAAPPTATSPRASLASTISALALLAERRVTTAVLIAAGYSGQEIAGRLAVRLDAGVITDAIDVRPSAEGPVAVQSCLAHSYLVESRVRRGVPVITVHLAAVAPAPAEAPVEPILESVLVPASLTPRAARVQAISRPPQDRSTPDLATADVVVAGGRGVGSAEAFGVLDGIAEVLGGAVGGTHTATELGWCPRDRRIGLTGQTVHPGLYLAAGVSGSVRHRAGMQGAKTVVAIGDDPAAPIFRLAELGVVGDLRDVLPALLAEMRRHRARRSPGSLGEAEPAPDPGPQPVPQPIPHPTPDPIPDLTEA